MCIYQERMSEKVNLHTLPCHQNITKPIHTVAAKLFQVYPANWMQPVIKLFRLNERLWRIIWQCSVQFITLQMENEFNCSLCRWNLSYCTLYMYILYCHILDLALVSPPFFPLFYIWYWAIISVRGLTANDLKIHVGCCSKLGGIAKLINLGEIHFHTHSFSPQ